MLDQLNTQGGHILVLLILVVMGGAGVYFRIPHAEVMFGGAYSALLYAMNPSGNPPKPTTP